MERCKDCEQEVSNCPCKAVDAFFEANWDLMHRWNTQAEYRSAYEPKAEAPKAKEVRREVA